jgi:hypothetical protein
MFYWWYGGGNEFFFRDSSGNTILSINRSNFNVLTPSSTIASITENK